ncbi:PREDICTED: delta(3,5)-Delta(2,4)-dienoyl-CoA isomerase, mitochondrial [Haliaeetus leucocephalus]|uniref:delta(3,5)-Delta(2,4)-dienoyl-CoA isomerase, mitochondrial n=1 Tax=Haliaeetus leucocephalus TaxID=52644 RepID=UPI00053CC6AF|nr:PREDICTED: delta(3,5)-Delta(2,4)-dienoyl-CoA isomerase, mitochondrial [Haliaeetus leucocephalus]
MVPTLSPVCPSGPRPSLVGLSAPSSCPTGPSPSLGIPSPSLCPQPFSSGSQSLPSVSLCPQLFSHCSQSLPGYFHSFPSVSQWPQPFSSGSLHLPRDSQSFPGGSQCPGDRLGAAALRVPARLMSAEAAERRSPSRSFETLRVTSERDHILHVELHRPEKRNAMNVAFWRGSGGLFPPAGNGGWSVTARPWAGIDLMDMGSAFLMVEGEDMARKAWNLRRKIRDYQETFSVLEKCPKPVIAAVHGACIGAGIDLISACDIRYCTQDAWFQVKVGRWGPSAQSSGLVSRVFADKEMLLQGALEMAATIAARSPVAVQGTKVNLVYSRDHPVSEGLRYVATWNMSMLQTEDILKSVQAAMEKKGPEDIPFSKL